MKSTEDEDGESMSKQKFQNFNSRGDVCQRSRDSRAFIVGIGSKIYKCSKGDTVTMLFFVFIMTLKFAKLGSKEK